VDCTSPFPLPLADGFQSRDQLGLIVYRTHQALEQKVQDIWKSLNQLMENKKNYALYRDALRHITSLPVPFLGTKSVSASRSLHASWPVA